MEQREKSNYHVDLANPTESSGVFPSACNTLDQNSQVFIFQPCPVTGFRLSWEEGMELGQGSILQWRQTLKKTTTESSLLTAFPQLDSKSSLKEGSGWSTFMFIVSIKDVDD